MSGFAVGEMLRAWRVCDGVIVSRCVAGLWALFLAEDTLNRPGCLHARACELGPDPDVRVDLSLDLQKKFDPHPTRHFFFEWVPKIRPEVFGGQIMPHATHTHTHTHVR